jgi:hypothetical protein
MYTAAVFLDNEKAFHTTRHAGLLYKLSKLEFSTSLNKFISFSFAKKNFSRWPNVYAKGNARRGVSRFCLVLHIVQDVHK